MSLPVKDISDFVRQSQGWMQQSQDHQKAVLASAGQVPVIGEGTEVMLLGRMRRIRLLERTGETRKDTAWAGQLTSSEARFFLDKNISSSGSFKRIMRAFCEQLTRQVIEREIQELSSKMRLRPKRLRFGWQDTRWGSCSSLGTVSFNCRLAVAPIETIRYVVIHELSHLQEANHSARFWAIVEEFCPDHRIHRKWLRQNQHYTWYLK